MEHHRLDPAARRPNDRIDSAELTHRRSRLGHFLQVAAPKLDHLFRLVGTSGCGVLLTDSDGVVLDQRCNNSDVSAFREWGLWPGADWSEASEGTNGIGTCLTERRSVTIHRGDHYFVRNTAMSCMDSPVFGADGNMIAALDVSSARVDQTEGFNQLIAAMVAHTARSIEADYFHASFPHSRIVVAPADDTELSVLLAIDADDLVVGATRGARRAFGLKPTGSLKPRPASDLFDGGDGRRGFETAERAAVMRALARAEGNVSEAARQLGIGRATLYRHMKRLDIKE